MALDEWEKMRTKLRDRGRPTRLAALALITLAFFGYFVYLALDVVIAIGFTFVFDLVYIALDVSYFQREHEKDQTTAEAAHELY